MQKVLISARDFFVFFVFFFVFFVFVFVC